MLRLRRLLAGFALWASCALGVWVVDSAADEPAVLAGTAPLTWEGDLASRLVDGVDKFLLNELARSVTARERHWKRDLSSPEKYVASVAPDRARLAHILGLRDARRTVPTLELISTAEHSAVVASTNAYRVYEARWPVVGDITAEGLLLVPNRVPRADLVALPDADQTPEMLVGLVPGLAPESQFARRLAESGFRVIVPTLVSRKLERRKPIDQTAGRANLTNREYLYRAAFELGRHLIGYEVQTVQSAVDWFVHDARGSDPRVGVIGWGEGGLVALYAAAVDPRIDAVCVSGYFDSRQNVWQEPLDRNVFGLLDRFGDAELASLVAPRPLIVEACRGPELTLPSDGGAPARLVTPELAVVRSEVERAQTLVKGLAGASIELVVSGPDGRGAFGSAPALASFVAAVLSVDRKTDNLLAPSSAATSPDRPLDAAARQARRLHEIDRHNQAVLAESPFVRAKFMAKLDTKSVAAYEKSAEPYRAFFRDEVIGHFDRELLAPQPRTRRTYDRPAWTGYEVVLDVFPDVFAYGVLLVPKNIPAGERRPVVVCQHGLEGRPQDVLTGDHPAYHDFAAKLCERGFVTFAPQNLYIFKDRFRTLQRKANPLQKTLFSVIVPQHRQIVAWLGSLPFVDRERIGFYGLSYGGKSAMRIPPLVEGYCLSICSADFNEWVGKNASTRLPYSYMWTGEYEIFEFDLGSTFNYAEMAALIAPRPFMVERGHFDGVGLDEAVGYEYAKVQHLYAARLKIPQKTTIEWFDGPHTINGRGTFDFLERHLRGK